MQIVKGIGSNAAIGIDAAGKEVLLIARGIGFPKMPYELTDMKKIQRTFYDVDPRYAQLIAQLPQAVLLASADVVEQAEFNLDCDMNPNLSFTLADHINFAIERFEKGIELTTPLSYDIQHLYPREYELGLLALDVVQDYCKVRLPDSEAASIAMHFVSGETEGGDIQAMMEALRMIDEAGCIAEEELHFTLDKSSYNYSRFAIHLQYLIQRLASGKPAQDGTGRMLGTMAREYPAVYLCAQKIAGYFKQERGWECTKDEVLYLMMHINRVRGKDEN